ncbi:efflux RND transporter periplasmic adaptor subunit [Variovorax sp. PCZ-1]|uniref:efflux RND transporter periplasmic adaptor subunit n=1 Tax=Variovorax sp. PCZ-1 TaxID=2835533 RepID=UPI0020BDFABF|nr:efflux RND transporter periplasmic adaptor subunit [Variovorax sp. PCZ-1]
MALWSALIAVALLAACSKPAPAPEPVRAVKIHTVGSSGLVSGYEYSGEVRARVESRLGFRVAGKIVKRQAEVGQRVKAGQVLAQLDPQDYKLAADGARAALAVATTNRDLAAADFKRFQSLKEQNFISGAELERRETTFKAAQAQVQQAQAQLANVGNQVGYANLVADVSGVVTAVDAEVGQVVSAGSPVVRIAQDGARDVVFSVPEDKMASVAVGSAVKARRWADGDGGELSGKIRELAASADPLTRTFQAKMSLDASANLPLGATVYVFPSTSLNAVSAIKLPTSSLMQNAQGASTVWLLDTAAMTVNPVIVQVATADGNEAVIAAGVKPGDKIVSAGIHVLSPGLKVTIFNEKGAPAGIQPAQGATKSVVSSGSATTGK